MDNKVQIFNNEQFGQVRTLDANGKTYFVGKDIAEILGYANPTKAISTHCKGVSKMGIPSNGGIQQMNVITEGDIYRLTARSELPGADKFESWVFDEVLPSIRKTGSYRIAKEKTEREKAFEIIAELPNDRYKNKAVVKILNFVDNNNEERTLKSKPTLTDEEVKSILEDYITIGDGILKETINGLALEKEKLYRYFAKYGMKKIDVLRAIERNGLIPEIFTSRTPTVKHDGHVIRAIVVKEM